MDIIDCCVVGSGVIGMAIARKFAMQGHEVLVLEAEKNIASQTSSRNSGVIHAGLYYPPESLKAQTCVSGNKLLYAYCQEKSIAVKKCGKLVVATDRSQAEALKTLKAQGEACGVKGLELLTKHQVETLEPALQVESALFSPSTGIVDVQGFLQALQTDLENHQGRLVANTFVEKISFIKNNKYIELEDNYKVKCNIIINAAGHQAIPLAASLAQTVNGTADIKNLPKRFFAKGSYFSFAANKEKLPFSHLIYPMPEPGGLGIHLSFDIHGQARFGPDVEWVKTAHDVKVNPERAALFYQQIRRYWPALPDDSLSPDYAGVRPKITGPGQALQDFIIQTADTHGILGLVHLFGIESPGLTASLAIADRVYGLIMHQSMS